MKKLLPLVYGIAVYLFFVTVSLYAIAFTGNLVVEKTIDSTPRVSLSAAFMTDSALLLLFALQISLLPKSVFMRWFNDLLPAYAERCSLVLVNSCCLLLVILLWQPIGGTIWAATGQAGRGLLQFLFFLGWGLVVISTMLANHFELFGLRQVWLHYKGMPLEPSDDRTPLHYRYARAPLYMGFVLALWCSPHMTVSHLLLAITSTAYALARFRVQGVGLRVAAAF